MTNIQVAPRKVTCSSCSKVEDVSPVEIRLIAGTYVISNWNLPSGWVLVSRRFGLSPATYKCPDCIENE